MDQTWSERKLSSKELKFGGVGSSQLDWHRLNGQGEAIILALPPNSAANSHSVCHDYDISIETSF